MKVYLNEAAKLCTQVLKARLTPFIHGQPGLGKSAMVKQIADQFNLELIDIRLSTLEPIDLSGFPNVEKGIASYIPFDWFPLESTPIPEGKEGWLLFFDEANAADISVQKACYRTILDHEVGQHKLHPNCLKIAAGNLITDGAAVNRLTTALQSRLIHVQVQPDTRPAAKNTWLHWALDAGLDSRVISYLSWKENQIHNYNPQHDEMTFPTPRTWHFVSDLLITNEIENITLLEHLALLEGAVGTKAASEFISFCRVYESLVSVEDIHANPDIAFADTPDICHALCGVLASTILSNRYSNMGPFIAFSLRMNVEFQVILFQQVIRKDSKKIQELMAYPMFKKHIINELGKYL